MIPRNALELESGYEISALKASVRLRLQQFLEPSHRMSFVTRVLMNLRMGYSNMLGVLKPICMSLHCTLFLAVLFRKGGHQSE